MNQGPSYKLVLGYHFGYRDKKEQILLSNVQYNMKNKILAKKP